MQWNYINAEDLFSIQCEQDEVEEVLREIVYYAKGAKSLIILDHCASSKQVKNRTCELLMLGFSPRHFGISVIAITQQLTSIAKPHRENISRLVFFYNNNNKDMNTIMDENLGYFSEEKRKRIIETIKKIKHSCVDAKLTWPFDYKLKVE